MILVRFKLHLTFELRSYFSENCTQEEFIMNIIWMLMSEFLVKMKFKLKWNLFGNLGLSDN